MTLFTVITRKGARIIIAGAAILFFTILAVSTHSRPVSLLRERTVRLLSPITRGAGYVGEFFTGASRLETREWEEDRRRLASAEAERVSLQKENTSLRRLLGLKEYVAIPTVSASVLVYTSVMGRETLVIDAGQKQGITQGDIVIDENRLLVGHVSAVSAEEAKVSVASNPGMTFSASLVPLGGKILIKGIGGRALALELIPHDTPLRDGDFVQWTPEGRRGSPNIFAGRVIKDASAASGAFKTGSAVLLADPGVLKQVLIMTKE